MKIYHKLKVSYIIRLVIIKHALVKELLILQVQNDDIKPWKKCTFKYQSRLNVDNLPGKNVVQLSKDFCWDRVYSFRKR